MLVSEWDDRVGYIASVEHIRRIFPVRSSLFLSTARSCKYIQRASLVCLTIALIIYTVAIKFLLILQTRVSSASVVYQQSRLKTTSVA